MDQKKEEKITEPEELNLDDELEEEESSTGQWLKDNLRIIISILIVVVIAAGIYSYSNRTEAPTKTKEDAASEIISQITGNENKNLEQSETATEIEGENVNTNVKQEQQKTEQVKQQQEVKKPEQTSSTATSQETEGSFIETAALGDSRTKLARRALADYLEKNADSTLTSEHKIYIEDYLQKNAGNKGKVNIGTSVEFSKGLISDAITKAKNLNEQQLKNLHKYAVRVPSLT